MIGPARHSIEGLNPVALHSCRSQKSHWTQVFAGATCFNDLLAGSISCLFLWQQNTRLIFVGIFFGDKFWFAIHHGSTTFAPNYCILGQFGSNCEIAPQS
jgi:hypothetical protein